MASNYSKEDIQNFHTKDRRISWLSIFSSLCNAHGTQTPEELSAKATKINNELYVTYPFVENTSTFVKKPQGSGKFNSTSDLKCDYCHASLVKTKDGSAFRCPNWKKDGSGCKGTYVKPGEENRSRSEDNITDESAHQEYGEDAREYC